jgi:hypothetical protein
MIVVLLNIVLITAINGCYVYMVVSGDYSFRVLIGIAFMLSIFKIIWNFILLRGSVLLEAISDNTIVWLCLFNNLLAPLLAEMFVSSDCFHYIVIQAPSLTFNYDIYSCRFETSNVGFSEICDASVLAMERFKRYFLLHRFIIPINVPSH